MEYKTAIERLDEMIAKSLDVKGNFNSDYIFKLDQQVVEGKRLTKKQINAINNIYTKWRFDKVEMCKWCNGTRVRYLCDGCYTDCDCIGNKEFRVFEW